MLGVLLFLGLEKQIPAGMTARKSRTTAEAKAAAAVR
jgi:hypothetical protein